MALTDDEIREALAAGLDDAQIQRLDSEMSAERGGSLPEPTPAPAKNSPWTSRHTPRQSKLSRALSETGRISGGIGRAAGQGLTFGWADEAAAGIGALTAKAMGDKEPLSDIYSGIKGSLTERQKDFSRQNPVVSGVSEIVGAVVPAFLTAGAAAPAAGAKLLQTIGRGAAIGGGQGALYGAGTGEGISDTAEKTLIGGGLGLAAGAALPVIGAGLGYTKNAIANTFFQNADQKSARIIQEAAEQAGITPDDFVKKYTELGPEAIPADVHPSLRRQAKIALNRFSPAQETASKFVDTRQSRQQADLLASVSKHIGGGKSDDIYAALESNQQARKSAAPELYEKAWSAAMPEKAKYNKVLQSDEMQKLLTIGRDEALSDLSRINKTTGLRPDVSPVEMFHHAKRFAQGKQGEAIRAGNSNEARKWSQKIEVLRDVLDDIPEYVKANDMYADSMALENAAELGKGFLKANPREFSKEFAKLGDSEKEMARLSVINDLANTFGSKSDKRSVYQMLTDVPNARDNLKTVFGSQEALDDFLKSAKKWDAFSATRKEFNQSTITQPLMSAESQMADIAEGLSSPIQASVKRGLRKYFGSGMDAETANALASKLTTPGLTAEQARFLIEKSAKNQKTGNALAAPIYTIQTGGAISNQ